MHRHGWVLLVVREHAIVREWVMVAQFDTITSRNSVARPDCVAGVQMVAKGSSSQHFKWVAEPFLTFYHDAGAAQVKVISHRRQTSSTALNLLFNRL
jgi:hypothetical protein